LLNIYNIFSYAPPEFWILRNKSNAIKILLDNEFKIDTITNNSKIENDNREK
jgi:hypothetical protein